MHEMRQRMIPFQVMALANASAAIYCQMWSEESTDVHVVVADKIMIQNRTR